MFLSHLLINTGNDPNAPVWNISRRWLRNLYRVHQRLCMAFPSVDRKGDDPLFLKPYRADDFQAQVHIGRTRRGFFSALIHNPGAGW